jgi:hypothetical protein
MNQLAPNTGPGSQQHGLNVPHGLLRDVAQYILASAPYPNPDIALAGAIGFLAGVVGREYNVCGLGLNQYILVLSPTGTGKEAIAAGISKLFGAVAASVPSVLKRLGPSYIQSAPALIKALAQSPCFVWLIGEVGLRMAVMAGPKANPNDKLTMAVMLDCYGKSGHGYVLGAIVYSDRDKNVPAINSPALTIIGEGVPETFYEAVDETHIASGLLPRFLAFENQSRRPYLNRRPAAYPDPDMVQTLADLTKVCLTAQDSGRLAGDVGFDTGGADTFARFEPWVTDQINAAHSEVTRQLWNRAYVKALKLAALSAVGRNYLAPIITLEEAMWATSLVVDQTNAMLAKFTSGDVGEVGGNQLKQQSEVIRVIREYMTSAWLNKYHGTAEMHRDGVVTLAHIQQRLYGTAAFKRDRIGAREAIVRTVKSLLDADTIREVPQKQMVEKYGRHPRSFVVSDPTQFARGG